VKYFTISWMLTIEYFMTKHCIEVNISNCFQELFININYNSWDINEIYIIHLVQFRNDVHLKVTRRWIQLIISGTFKCNYLIEELNYYIY
jgi:hypothetical protein